MSLHLQVKKLEKKIKAGRQVLRYKKYKKYLYFKTTAFRV